MGDVKPDTMNGGDDSIQLRVVNSTEEAVNFKVKMSTTMLKIRKSYAERVGVNFLNLRIKWDGAHVADKDTPASLGMENNDALDVYEEAHGG